MEKLVSLLNLTPAKTDKQGSTSLKNLPKEGEENFKTTLDEAFQTIETHGKNGTEITAKAIVSSRTAKESLAEEQEIRDIKSIKDIKDIIRLSSEKKLNLKSLTVEIHREGSSDKKLVIKRGNGTEKETPKIMLTASDKPSVSKEQPLNNAKNSIDLKELIAQLDKDKETKPRKQEEPQDKKQAKGDKPVSQKTEQVKSPAARALEAKTSETDHPKHLKVEADIKTVSDKDTSVKENQPAPQSPKSTTGSQASEQIKADPKEQETGKTGTKPLDNVPPEDKSSQAKPTAPKERIFEQNVRSDTVPKTADTLPDDLSVQQKNAQQKPLLKEIPTEVPEKTDNQEKLPQDTVPKVQNDQKEKNSLKQALNETPVSVQEKRSSTEKPLKQTSKVQTLQDEKQPQTVQATETKSMTHVQNVKQKSEAKIEESAAPVKSTRSGETTNQTPKQRLKETPSAPLQQMQPDPSPKSTATPPVSKPSKSVSTPVRSQKTDLAELLKKQLSTKQAVKTARTAEGVVQKAKTTSAETPAADSKPPVEAKQTETRTPHTADSSKNTIHEPVKNTTRNTGSAESAAEEKTTLPQLDEEQKTSKESKPADPIKSVQKTQTTGTSASLNALIASKKAESKETKKIHPVKSDSDIRPMPFQQTTSAGVTEMPQTSRDLISKMLSKNISPIAAGTIKNDALFDETVQKAKTGMETALESISENEKTGDETIQDVAKPDDIKGDTVKSRVTAARATVNHFVNDLKERIENYKAPLMKITLDLNPKNLGSVGVTLLNRGKNLHVQIHSNSQAIQLFMQNNADFKNALNDLGYRDVQLGFSSGQGSSAGHDGGQGGYRDQAPSYYEGQTRDQVDGESEEMEIILPNIVYG